ncbi:hypothetical protein [Streptomyces sp. NBC_01013]|uniref:hypothetical protein n=1 Tax=Streptomyces sp. NBC_01013 TaxID=2903718 RepID=UPI003862ED6D|nr:hypothetical protein OG538_15515 [Streptomyces sp. NBC_01013]
MGRDGTSIPDEEWERFLRDAEAGAPGAPEEPSARARMVARRMAEEPPPREGWRTHAPPVRSKGKAWYFVAFFVLVALLVVALDPGRVTGWFGGGGDPAPLAAESARPTRPPATEAAAERPTLDDPFRGSPAAAWGDGVASLPLPRARATGWMSKAEVARALERSRDFLAASGLDPEVLRGERPKEAIALINPRQKDMQEYVSAAFRAPSAEHDPLRLFSRFAPSKVRVVGDVVKTRGRITYGEGKRGAVEVTADVTYVYPVVRAAAGSEEVTRTIVRREIVMGWDDPSKIITEPGTFSMVSYRSDTTNGGCDNHTGYFVPEFAADRAASDGTRGPGVDPYDRSTSMDTRMAEAGEAECGAATRL